jgi:hypothetical protein
MLVFVSAMVILAEWLRRRSVAGGAAARL